MMQKKNRGHNYIFTDLSRIIYQNISLPLKSIMAHVGHASSSISKAKGDCHVLKQENETRQFLDGGSRNDFIIVWYISFLHTT